MGGQRPLCELLSELRAGRWERLVTVETGLTLLLFAENSKLIISHYVMVTLFHQNTNYVSKLSDDIITKFLETPQST